MHNQNIIRYKSFYFLYAILFSFLAFNVNDTYAAEVYFAPHAGTIYTGDVFVLEARISSPDELINVADGAFLFDKEKLEIKELSVGGSIFSLWVLGPTFSNTDGRANFVGGVPDGFQGEEGLIVKAILHAKQEGETTLFFESSFSLLLSDGKGTNIRPETRPLTLTIAKRPGQMTPKDEWKDIIGADTLLPEFVETIISKDSRFFDNKYFVSFFATDEGSGVAYYEIKEGDRVFTRAVSPYVLQDQTLGGTVQIKSVDSAGNENVVTLQPTPVLHTPFYKTILFWIGVILLLVLAGAVVLRSRMKRQDLNES